MGATRRRSWLIAGAALTLGALGCPDLDDRQAGVEISDPQAPGAEPGEVAPTRENLEALANQARATFGILPEVAASEASPITEARVALGRALYHDPALSRGGETSCNACHDLGAFGVGQRAVAIGHPGQPAARNAPSTYNAALQFAQFWDFRAERVEDLLAGGGDEPGHEGLAAGSALRERLRGNAAYAPAFRAAFPDDPDPVRVVNAGQALGAFLRTLMTPSRFDAFMGGDLAALSPGEVVGLRTFIDLGCVQCHQGPLVGGAMAQPFGVADEVPTDDPGRASVTGQDYDARVFKVPSLRNVTETAPYTHDGSVTELREMVGLMGRVQLGRSLTSEQVDRIVEFLGALRGRTPEQAKGRGSLPKEGAEVQGEAR